jgi:hypothetical protein
VGIRNRPISAPLLNGATDHSRTVQTLTDLNPSEFYDSTERSRVVIIIDQLPCE